jgi:two-component system nitrogen regulation response regulator NtrX
MASDVLVVDDEADIRDLVAGILSDEGYSVRTAANASSESPAVRTE